MSNVKKTICELLSHDDYKIHLRNAGVFRFPVGYSFEEHIQPEVEIIYVKSGGCIAVVENNFIPLKEGDCLVIQPFVRHGMTVKAQVPYCLAQVEYSLSYEPC